MDDRHEQIIGTHRAELTRKLTIKNNLLWEELIELKVITGGEVECIKEKYPAEKDQISELLNHLQKRPWKDWEHFKQALKSTNQSHLLVLCGDQVQTTDSGNESLISEEYEAKCCQRTRKTLPKRESKENTPNQLKREGDQLLDADRKAIIKENRECLQEQISIKGEILLDLLVEKGVISPDKKIYIEKTEDEEIQVSRLLNIVMKKSNEAFDEFCKALFKTGQTAVVQELLMTKVDINTATQKLADYYEREFTEISLYSSSEEKNKIPLPKLYVPMTWRRYKQAGYGKLENLTSYTDIWIKIAESHVNVRKGKMIENVIRTVTMPILHQEIPGIDKWRYTRIEKDSRIVIDGVPGAGKTTFVKRVSYIWAQAVKRNIKEEIAKDYSIESKIVIPIILRLVKNEDTLLDIILSQLSFLTIPEICSVIHLAQTNPDDIVLLFDGYDELSRSDFVTKVLTKEKYPEVLCLTTSRPHAVEQLKRITSQALDQHITLIGFSSEQVQEYITLFFIHHFGDSLKGDDLILYLKSEKRELLAMARVPIRCEMICIVWAVYGKLGKTIADLYTLFIIHLLDHMEHKYQSDIKASEDQLLMKYHPVLMKVGKLANTWINRRRLRIVFTTAQVRECLQGHFEDAIKIGLIIKSHPNSQLEKSQWSFPHLTIQEFLVAYYLGDADHTTVADFVNINKGHSELRRNETIFQFLCSKHPNIANTVLEVLIRSKITETESRQLVLFITDILPFYGVSPILLPSPKHLDLTKIDPDTVDTVEKSGIEPSKKDNTKLLKCVKMFLEMDRKENLRHLNQLKIKSILKVKKYVPNLLGQTYVSSLSLALDQDPLDGIAGVNRMTSLKHVELTLSDFYDKVRIQALLNILPNGAMESLNLSGNGVMAVDILRFENLKTLTVEEKSDLNDDIAILFLSRINQCPLLTQVHCYIFDMCPAFLSRNSNAALYLTIKQKEDNEMMVNAETLCISVNIHKLDFSYIEMDEMGQLLGRLLVILPHLQILILKNCDIYQQSIEEITDEMNKSNKKSTLKELDLNANINLGGCGTHLGKMIGWMPELQILGLGGCYLTSFDLVSLSQALPVSTNIHQIDLYRCNVKLTGQNDSCHFTSNAGCLLEHMPFLTAMRIGDQEDFIPEMCYAVQEGALTKLKFLDMMGTKFLPGSLDLFSQHLVMMENLEYLNLRAIHGVKGKGYQLVYQNIPPSLKHINVIRDHSVKLDPYLMLESKHHLSHLLRINVDFNPRDLEMLQELLEEENPDIRVYYEPAEDYVWNFLTH